MAKKRTYTTGELIANTVGLLLFLAGIMAVLCGIPALALRYALGGE